MSSYGGRPPPRAGILPRLLRLRLLPEQGVHEGLRVEDLEVVDLLADPDQLDRYPQLLVDPDRDAALGGAVELGQHEAGEPDRLVEHARLLEPVLARGRFQHHEGFVGGAGHLAGQHALELGQLVHEVGLGVQAPRRVHQQHVHITRRGCLHRVEDHRGRVGARDLVDDVHLDPAAPLLELLQHRLVHRTGDGEDGPQALVHQLAGAPQSLPDALPEGAEQAHDPEAGAWGSSSRWITVPFGPSGGRTLPFRASSTPPALPMVTRKRRSADHSRLAPAGSSSSVARPSSGWTRIQVGSTALIRRRCGPGLLLTTAGAGVGAGVAAGLLAGVAGGWATAGVGAGAATGRGASPGGVTGAAACGAGMERSTGAETSIFGAATEVPPVRFTVRLITISAMPRITRRASPTS